jgi:hypothetical protein
VKDPLAIDFSIDKQANRIRLDFGKPIVWFSAEPEDCRNIARELLRRAFQLDGKTATRALREFRPKK